MKPECRAVMAESIFAAQTLPEENWESLWPRKSGLEYKPISTEVPDQRFSKQ
jgi:hypothetical protein